MSSSTIRKRPQNFDGATPETQGLAFELDRVQVFARAGESLWDVARRVGTAIPHLCHRPEPGYRPDGNCRACMVEMPLRGWAAWRRTPHEAAAGQVAWAG